MEIMVENDIEALSVTERGSVVGIFSERDYDRKKNLNGSSLKKISVRKLMSTSLVSISPEKSIEECVTLMTDTRNNHLPVFENNKLIAIVSVGDVEKSKTILREKIISEASKKGKRKLTPNLIIGLSISFLILLGIITFNALRIPVSNTNYQTTPKELDSKEHLPKSENILIKPFKEQAGSRILDEDALSNKANEAQHIDTKSIIQVRSDNNIDTENTLNEKLKADDQYASRLVYTIQIKSQKKIENAQKQFNFILRSLTEKNLKFLRIEKVGKYYTLRLGKFENYETSKKFLQEMKPRLSGAIILKANIKNERIIRLYK
jgi:predicted transcriptional regulator